MKIVDAIRSVTATVDDDFFGDELIEYYANQGQLKVVNELIQVESNRDVSFRALDKLRKIDETSTGSLQFTEKDMYFQAPLGFPADYLTHTYLDYDAEIPFKELTWQRLGHLSTGNAIPTEFEVFYTIAGRPDLPPGTKTANPNLFFRLFLHEKADDKVISLYYFKTPTQIHADSEQLIELPSRFYNVVVYAASILMAMQEKNVNVPAGELNQVYQAEFNRAAY